MNKSVLLIVVMLLLQVPSFGQDAFQQLQTANQKFEDRDFISAIRFYKDALKASASGDIAFAQFQLGECYRNLLDYASAEYHYQQSVQLKDRRYPLARFHYASMLKQNGKYDEALPQFETFIEDIKSYFDDNESYRNYFNQAKNEREGCVLALTALSTPKPDYNLTALPGPVNTDNNDYAATFYGSENEIYVTSARRAKKGSVRDNSLGENFSDVYGFTNAGGSWKAL